MMFKILVQTFRTVEVFSQETLLKEISDGIAEEMETIEQSLKGQEMENWKWAVRSSGTSAWLDTL